MLEYECKNAYNCTQWAKHVKFLTVLARGQFWKSIYHHNLWKWHNKHFFQESTAWEHEWDSCYNFDLLQSKFTAVNGLWHWPNWKQKKLKLCGDNFEVTSLMEETDVGDLSTFGCVDGTTTLSITTLSITTVNITTHILPIQNTKVGILCQYT